MSCITDLLTQFSQFKNGDNYVGSKEDFERVLTNSKNIKIKKKMCSYFIWMNEHRKDIEKEYFSDFFNIEDWTFENKKEYYISKGLDTNKVVKSGRPRIASLITTKAGILWKQLSDIDKHKYEQISNNLKAVVSVAVENYPKEKKKRGRPRKNKESKNVSDAAIEYCNKESKLDDEIKVEVETFEFNGKQYWLDIKTFEIYDPDTQDIVGKKNGENIYINPS